MRETSGEGALLGGFTGDADETRFRRIVTEAPIPLMVFSDNGRTALVSHGFVELTGFTLDDVPTIEDWKRLASVQDPKGIWHRVITMACGDRDAVEEGEVTVRTKSGEERAWAVSLAPVGRLASGECLAIVRAMDITGRRLAEQELAESQETLRKILDSALDAVVTVDDEGNVVEWRGSSAQMFGWEAHEAVGRPLRDLIVPERYRAAHFEGLRRVAETGRGRILGQRIEIEAVARDGREFPVELIITQIQVRGKTRFCGFIRDLSELRALTGNLERIVAERTEALEAANRELEGFTYSIAHDLRTALRGIVANARVLQEDHFQKLDEDGRSRVQRLAGSALRLSALVDDLLEYARLARREVRRQPVDLTKLAEEVGERVVSQHPEGCGVRVEVEPGMSVVGDPEMLTLALENLVDNACKYGRPDGETVIQVGCSVLEGESVVRVSDNGIGFEMRYVHKLFQPFERLHRDEEYPGTGIGLANVARVVERHGGRVWAESEGPGRGSTFYLALPGASCGV